MNCREARPCHVRGASQASQIPAAALLFPQCWHTQILRLLTGVMTSIGTVDADALIGVTLGFEPDGYRPEPGGSYAVL